MKENFKTALKTVLLILTGLFFTILVWGFIGALFIMIVADDLTAFVADLIVIGGVGSCVTFGFSSYFALDVVDKLMGK